MAARNNLAQTAKTRDKIQGSQLVNTLQKHIFDGKELSSSQVNAATALLKKVLPDLKQSDITQETTINGNIKVNVNFE